MSEELYKQHKPRTEKVEKYHKEDDFICETEVFEEGKLIHYTHNPKTGEWKKSEACTR